MKDILKMKIVKNENMLCYVIFFFLSMKNIA
jgi:hypothetical protein